MPKDGLIYLIQMRSPFWIGSESYSQMLKNRYADNTNISTKKLSKKLFFQHAVYCEYL